MQRHELNATRNALTEQISVLEGLLIEYSYDYHNNRREAALK